MAVSAATPMWRPRVRALADARAAVPVALGAIALVSVLVRTREMGVGYWIDEGLSVGIADRPLGDIPGVLRLDGSPPLYYMVLHAWIWMLGDRGEETTHTLSLLIAVAAIPVAWALVHDLFGTRAAWIAAVLVALNPFLTTYAQETRMYALVVLLGLVATLCFLGAFALRRGRPWLAAFVVSYTALLYTHNWALFFGGALAAAWAVLVALSIGRERRALLAEGLVAAGIVLVLYAPWLPSMLFQAAHTGAPWARRPGLNVLTLAPGHLLGVATQYVLALGAGLGLARLLRRRAGTWSRDARAALALAVIAVGTLLVAWLASQASPAWATRYLAVAVPPFLLLAVLGLARAGAAGLVTCALVAVMWLADSAPDEKSNVREVAAAIAPGLRPGDLVISTQPEQAPVLHHYLRDVEGLRWATLTGRLTDLGVTDWRDGVERLQATTPERDLMPLIDDLRVGSRVVLIQPEVYNLQRWSAPWTSLVRRRSTAWEQAMHDDRRLRVVNVEPASATPQHPNPVRATVLVKVAVR